MKKLFTSIDDGVDLLAYVLSDRPVRFRGHSGNVNFEGVDQIGGVGDSAATGNSWRQEAERRVCVHEHCVHPRTRPSIRNRFLKAPTANNQVLKQKCRQYVSCKKGLEISICPA